jgi:hypothetical protein
VAEVSEIDRLKCEFGWADVAPNEDGVRVPNQSSGLGVAFPKDHWDDEDLNHEGVGVWGEIRLNAIHQLMIKYGQSVIWEVGAGNGGSVLGLPTLDMKR